MPVSRKRKSSSEEHVSSSTQLKPIATQSHVRKYDSEPFEHDGETFPKKRKVNCLAKDVLREKKNAAPQLASKQEAYARSTSGPVEEAQPANRMAPTVIVSNKRSREEDQQTPRNKRFKDALPPSPAETPTRGARSLFDKLDLARTHITTTPSKTERHPLSPPLTPESLRGMNDPAPLAAMPGQVQDLKSLFASFLNATSLYYAHHGVGSPLHLSTLLSLITKSWKRRAVNEEDVRRILGILGKETAGFCLLDNGEGGVCLEQTNTAVINQHKLIARFELRLCDLWTRREPGIGHDAFMTNLPVAHTTLSESAADLSKTSKGQERLDGFKRGVLQARAEQLATSKPAVPEAAKSAAAVSSRGSNLLDRIMAKQQLVASKGTGPTQEELDRRAALHRIEEVVLVMDLLAGGRPRISFSSQMMVQHLQSSLRNPISREEAELCIDLMASTITPLFVSLINTGSVRGVVVKRAGRPSNAVLQQRLGEAEA